MNQRPLTILCCLVLSLLFVVSCSEDRASTQYKTHPTDWNYDGSDGFHGGYAASTASQSCAACHGADFAGGEAGVSCYTCHAGYPHPTLSSTSTAHAMELANLGWPMQDCQGCHGADFAGGKVGVGCLQCHTQPGGPAACNTCHAEVPISDAGLPQGMPSGSYGAHAVHVVEKGYACTECHARVTDVTHAGALPAEISFANARIARKAPWTSPFYLHSGAPESGNGSCASNYCHSNGRGGEPNDLFMWVGGTGYCAGCHSLPPTDPHPQRTDCASCHHNVDPTSVFPDDIRFFDPDLHVDGTVQF